MGARGAGRATRPAVVRTVLAAVVGAVLLAAASCGGDGGQAAEKPIHRPDLDAPRAGKPVLPDLSPAPPIDVQTKKNKDGTWIMRFSSVLVNVGKGDFVLHADRSGDEWQVVQALPLSVSGYRKLPIPAAMVWGGDGHNHWHIKRVATYRLFELDADGKVVGSDKGRSDTKIGFCFFDYEKQLERGPMEALYSRLSCGKQQDAGVDMGLSPGWNDTYDFTLPGQSIDIEGLPDGTYRLRGEADDEGLFREVTRDNNITWVDLELATTPDGLRTALVTDVGPEPR